MNWLDRISDDPKELKKEHNKRRKSYKEKSVKKSEYQICIDSGWEVINESTYRTRLKKEFKHDEKLENRVWNLFFLLRYPAINIGRDFKVRIERKNANPLQKQIDILAKDDETVIVTECKSSETMKKRSLQKDIEEFANLKGPISTAIKRHYGRDFKPKIIWLFVTNNIIWSDQDKERAKGENIHRITENQLDYYERIADHLRGGARFQFLAEFLKDQKISELENIKIPAIKGKIGGNTFYSFVSTPKQLLKVSFINHRSLNDPDGAPTYQRLVQKSRIKKISEYIKQDGFFPSNILANFKKKPRFDQIDQKDELSNVHFGHLYLPPRYRSLWIIDGQHRLYGFTPLMGEDEEKDYLSQNIIVLAFEELDPDKEAELFVTINHEQKSVRRDLLDELEGELKWGSDNPRERIGAISSRLIRELGKEHGNAFFNKIVQLDIKSTDEKCLTVPEIKNGIKNSGLIGTVFKRKEFQPGPLSGIDDEQTLKRAKETINLYFDRIANSNRKIWDTGRKGFLCTNPSIQGYVLLLSSMIKNKLKNNEVARNLSPEKLIGSISCYMEPIYEFLKNTNQNKMEETFKVPYGAGGPSHYHYLLCKIVKETFPNFDVDGYKDWETGQSSENRQNANNKIGEINIWVHEFIFRQLKAKHGKDFFSKGITSKQIKIKTYQKSVEDNEKLSVESYLDFIDYKKIVEQPDNWSFFENVFTIPLERGATGKRQALKWMERINELRRIPAHPTKERNYTPNDFAFIDEIHERLKNNIDKNDESQE